MRVMIRFRDTSVSVVSWLRIRLKNLYETLATVAHRGISGKISVPPSVWSSSGGGYGISSIGSISTCSAGDILWTAIGGIVVGLAILYFPDKDLKELEKL
jgi:hypothetical protein